MKHLHTFEEFLNENNSVNEQDPKLTQEQNHLYALMEYIIMNYDEDDFDILRDRIAKKLKNYDWTYKDITGNKLIEIKEILKKYYIKEKLITDKFLKNPAKKWQDFIAAYKWLIA